MFHHVFQKVFWKILLEEIQTENTSSIEQNTKRRMMRCRRRLIGTGLLKKNKNSKNLGQRSLSLNSGKCVLFSGQKERFFVLFS